MHIEVTSRAELWGPHSDYFKEAEIALTPRKFNIGAVIVPDYIMHDMSCKLRGAQKKS